MEIKIRALPWGITVLSVQGELDLYNAHQFKNEAFRLLETTTEPIALELSELEYIDSSGIGVLLFLFTQCKRHERCVFYVGLRGLVQKVIRFASLTGVLPIEDSLEDVRAILGNRP